MMKKNYKLMFIRVFILLVGLTIAHLGVTLFLLSNLGSDPYNVLVQGVYRNLSGMTGWTFLTHGRVHIALCFLIILVLLLVDRSYIKIGTILCMICGGPIIDIFTFILKPVISENSPLPYKIFMLALGCVILAYGMTIVIKSDAGTGPNDLVAVVISDKMHRSFGIVRVIVDLAFVSVGFLLGGSFGLGTIICAGCVGPVANFFLPVNERIVQKIEKCMLG
ncbi:MAG: YitT family protein [Oliverpabstia sp.]